ncbi:MAG: hypothetical protein ABI461_05890 [Polyangiaceae bacterium]
MRNDRETKYEAWKGVLEARGQSLESDHRRFNKLLLVGIVLSPLLLIWSKLAAVVIGVALILAATGHYIAMMYRWDYQRQRQRLDDDLARFAEEEELEKAGAVDEARTKYDAVRVPRRGALRFPFSKG